MQSVFISHSWHDKRLARKIAGTLETAGARVRLDDAEIKLGDSLVEKIRGGIDSVDFVVALISDKSCSSQWVSKELDVAMNQEIEGRRVKVLPILATKCDLPGFLKRKLYADMSNAKSFRQSLPMLLDRLGASPEELRRIRSKEPSGKKSSWLTQFRKDLSSDDPGKLYIALKNAPGYRADEIVADARLLDRIFDLADQAQPTHVRLLALRLIGALHDENFAHRIEPLLSDPNSHIRAAAIGCLSSLGSEISAIKVLQALRASTDPATIETCLEFFSRVAIHNQATALSLTSICSTIMEANIGDPGTELRVTRVIVQQMSGQSEIAMPLILSFLRSPNAHICGEALSGLLELSGDLWLPSPKSRQELTEAILECSRRDDPMVVAQSWLAMVLLADTLPEFQNRDRVWEFIQNAERWTVEAWLQGLGMLKLATVFDSPQDVAGLTRLYGKFGSQVDSLILDALAEIGGGEGLRFLAKAEYSPEGWKKIDVLRAMVLMPAWDDQFADLLRAACRDLPTYTGSEGQALSLLAQCKAGVLELEAVIAQFPSKFTGIYVNAEKDKEVVETYLRRLKEVAYRPTKGRITALLRRLSDENG